MAFVIAKSNLSLAVLTAVFLNGCAASKDVQPDETAILLCHDDRRTLTLPEQEAVKHLDHGDNIGACAGK